MEGAVYKFNGTTFGVQTGFGSPVTITDISNADPAEVTATNDYDTADVVRINDLAEPTQLDGNMFVVDNPNGSSFELNGVDSTDWEEFQDDSPPTANATKVTFSEFCELTGATQQDGGADQHEVSTICSTAKQFVQGLADPGTLQLEYNWAGNETVQAALRTARRTADVVAFKITFPNDGGIVVMFGTVQQTSFTGSQGSVVWTGSATIKLSGEIYVLEPTA